jgi:uncharacterized surface protein with fasciclin (FAS1) repeats
MQLGKRIITATAATFAAAGMAIGLTGPAAALSEAETNDFLGQLTATYTDPTVESDGNAYDFDIVTKAAIDTGATGILAGLDQFTLFAPNDRAFAVLASDLGLLPKKYKFKRTIDEGKVYSAIGSLGAETITKVLLYHVFTDAKVTGADVVAGPRSQSLTMANGQDVGVRVLSPRFPLIVLTDQDGRFFNDIVVRSKIDVVETDNTVVHGVSGVLLPDLTK